FVLSYAVTIVYSVLACVLCLFFFLLCSGDHLDLHSFPTRRSSDLAGRCPRRPPVAGGGRRAAPRHGFHRCARSSAGTTAASPSRSEEHTSELQSRGHLVCRLLLEKKKYRSMILVVLSLYNTFSFYL